MARGYAGDDGTALFGTALGYGVMLALILIAAVVMLIGAMRRRLGHEPQCRIIVRAAVKLLLPSLYM